MSNLDRLLIKEYKRLENKKKDYISTLEHSPAVSLVYKPSGGKTRAYLHWKERGHTKSKPVSADEIDQIREKIAQRKQYKRNIKDIEHQQKRILKVLDKDTRFHLGIS